MKFLDLQKQYNYLKPKIDARISAVLNHGQFIQGPEVNELEELLCNYLDVKNTITCANGTDALTLALMALKIGKGDLVFCPTFTYFATAESIAFTGATPVFVDSNKDTFNICVNDLEKKIIEMKKSGIGKIKAIIPVDLFGLPCDYKSIQDIAEKYDLLIIEDAAQGFGGEINGKKAGSFGHISITSFFPAKPLGCYGDGGALFTNSNELAKKLYSLREHGKGANKYDNQYIGMNSRLDTIQAAILIEKLAVFEEEVLKRNKVAQSYKKKYSHKYIAQKVPNDFMSSWAQYTVYTENRDEEILKLKKANVPTMVYYEKCLHLQKAFQYLKYKKGDFPVAEDLSNHVLSLPMHPYL